LTKSEALSGQLRGNLAEADIKPGAEARRQLRQRFAGRRPEISGLLMLA